MAAMDVCAFPLLGLLVSSCYFTSALNTLYGQPNDVHTTVKSLFEKIKSEQVKEYTPFIPPFEWEKQRGMYESDVKFYVHGPEDMYLFRDEFKVFDGNMFATTWITSALLEAYRYGHAPKPSEEEITTAILAVEEFYNKNVNFTNSLMTFWPQKYNVTTKTWVSYPPNLHKLFAIIETMDLSELEKLLEEIGLGNLASVLKKMIHHLPIDLKAFLIPPDFDDTFVNIGLGSLLTAMQDEFPESHAQWTSQNRNVTSAFDALKKYAYRPMSTDKAVNTIDCRTYFYLRHFLEEAVNKGEDIALIPTWVNIYADWREIGQLGVANSIYEHAFMDDSNVQDTDEIQTMEPRGVHMPFSINNIDVTVAANGVFGITTSVLNGLVDKGVLNDPDIQQIYLNTTSLIAYMIQTNFSSRPDLALLYYPSAFEFYWFVSRTYGELQSKSNIGPLPHPLLQKVQDKLRPALRTYMTAAVQNASKVDSDGTVYFDDFLGDGDYNLLHEPVIRGEDRLFTTAMAINALLSTWTVFDEASTNLVWEKDTPTSVKDTVTKAAGFLNKHVLGFKYKPWNAFFSASMKCKSAWPTYPVNRFGNESYTDKDGSMPNANSTIEIRGVEGNIPEAKYQELLKMKWWNAVPPIDFHGYNGYDDFWPFWTSSPYTHAISMLALAKFSNTVDGNV